MEENKHNENCIFCKIVKGEIPCYKIFENENILAYLDIFPVNSGHTLIIPKEHCENIFDIDEETLQEITLKSKEIGINLKEKLGVENINVLQSNGKTAGQEIFHYHMHIIPRYENDKMELRFNTSPEMIAPEKANEILNKLK